MVDQHPHKIGPENRAEIVEHKHLATAKNEDSIILTTRNKQLRLNWIFPKPNLSGGVKSNRLIAEAMVRRGHQVTLAYADRHKPGPPLWRPRKRRQYQKLVRAWQAAGHHLQESTATLLPVPRSEIRADDVPDADVTIATWWETAHWIKDWPTSKGLKAYFIRHYEVFGGDPDQVDATYRLPYRKLVIASWLQRLMADRFGDSDAILVPNGVDRNQFNMAHRDRNSPPAVGTLCGSEAWKGTPRAFEAIRIAQQTLPELQAVAFGSKPMPATYQPPANFTYHENPAQSLIPKIYQQVDCWLVASTSEGFGMPGLEAAASGCPLVVTRSGGPEDYIQQGVNGYLVDVGDARAMADRLTAILQQPAEHWREMSEASDRISRNFDWDRSAAILEDVLLADVENQHQGLTDESDQLAIVHAPSKE